jgi:predicted CoA-binding protein
MDGLDDSAIRDILTTTRRIALVGASANPARASHEVMGFLLAHGFDVTPVNPGLAGQTLLGRTVVASLDEAGPLEMVDLFRASEHVGPAVDDAIRLGAKVVWMQLGVVNEPAAEAARRAGLRVVMDRCPKIEWSRLGMRSAAAAAGRNKNAAPA